MRDENNIDGLDIIKSDDMYYIISSALEEKLMSYGMYYTSDNRMNYLKNYIRQCNNFIPDREILEDDVLDSLDFICTMIAGTLDLKELGLDTVTNYLLLIFGTDLTIYKGKFYDTGDRDLKIWLSG